LDDQRFARNILPDDKQLSQVMIRRLKSDLVDAEGRLLYAQRKLQALKVQYTTEERNVHQKLNDFCASRESGGRSIGTTFVNQLLKKRLFSSPSAFATTLEKHIATLSEGGRRKPKDVMTERILRKAILRAEEDYANDQSVEEAQTEAVEEATRLSEPLSSDQQQMVTELRDWAQRAKNRPDSKAKAILDWLAKYLKPGGQWNERRVILFTEYRTTHQWMQEILSSHGYGGDRLGLLHGGLSQDERGPIKAAFQASPKDSPIRILLATDAASEGIDLQKYCNYLIHLEIPYNPNVMEQRNGRIDRHGQREKEVFIWHPVDGGEAGQITIGGHGDDILRALRKLESMRADMGSVNPVIAPQMSGLIEGTLKDLDTRIAEAKIAKIEKSKIFVRAERAIEARVSALHARLLETQDQFHLTPDHILMAVKTALALEGQPALIPADLTGAPVGSIFRMPPMSGSWAKCAEGLEDPYLTGCIRPITFDHSVAKGRDDVVLVHLNHRLVQMCLRLLRAEVWAQDDVKKIHRVTVRSLPLTQIESPAVVVVSRLVITGGNHHRLHEELIVSGGYMRDQSFRREEGVSRLQQWLDDSTPLVASDELFDSYRLRFDHLNTGILQSIDARSKDRLKFLTNTLQNRKRQETEDIVAVLDELEKSIRIELNKDQQPEQLSLFSDEEHIQLRRDNAALESRLKRIPVERVQEVEAIEERYDKLTDRTFPVAVIFLVPEPASKGGAA